jgi:1-acyl-sn-glycerol-3-phosphate acyltransferase
MPRDPKRYMFYQPEHFSAWRSWFHLAVLRLICRPILMLTYRPKVYGRENVIKPGSFIVVSNHVDTFDPIMISHAIDYPIAYMAKRELFTNFWLSELFRLLGCFAIDRQNPSPTSLRTALNVLKSKSKWALCVFPEATRSRTGRLSPIRKGFSSLAKQTNVPVVPVGIHKNKSGKFVITVGEAITDVLDKEKVHEKVCATLAHLADPNWDREVLRAISA